jgi:MinD-like ATPase involved in chromosome partitioning or flagellar assembly/CheY-like chemotaxis protein
VKIEGSPVQIVVADHDIDWMMDATQELNLHHQVKVTGFARSGEDAIERASLLAADAVLMNYSMPDLTAKEVAARLADASPGTAVFAISDSVTAQLVQTAKAAGVAEIFPKSEFVAREVAEKIVEYVDAQRREWNEIAQKHGLVGKGTGPKGEKIKEKIITRTIKQTIILTYNVKGGVGKTTIATNLALAIKMSPYLSGQRVCLVDFDCGGANVATNMHIQDIEAINRNLSVWEHVSENNIGAKDVDDLLIPGPKGLMIAAAPLNQAFIERFSLELANKILNILKRHFSIIVIDGAPNVSAPIDAAFTHATHVLLIANPEGQSVKQLSRTIQLLSPDPDYPEKPDMSHLLRKTFLVLNHAQAPTKWDLSGADVAASVGRPLFVEIPYDPVVRKALHGTAGKVAVELEPDSEFAIAIKRLANDVCGAYPEGVGRKESKKKGLFSFLKR